MRLIMDPDNPLTDSDAPNQGELHMQAGDAVTVIAPDGSEVYVYSHPEDGELLVEVDSS
jgi:hypothetical protein